jgi:hypothetical protein
VGLNSLKSLNLTKLYPNNNKTNNNNNKNKVKSKPLELFEVAGKKTDTSNKVLLAMAENGPILYPVHLLKFRCLFVHRNLLLVIRM